MTIVPGAATGGLEDGGQPAPDTVAPDGAAADAERGRAATRNTVALLASRVVVSALGWAGSILIARALSPAGWGQYSFVFALLGLVSVLSDLGVGRVVLARLVDDDQQADARLVASSFIALRVLLGLLGYGVAVGYVLLVDHPDEVVRATVLAGLVVVIATPSHALTTIFQSRLRMTVVATAESVGQVLQLVLTLMAALFAPLLLVFVLPVIANEVLRLCLKVRALRQPANGPLPARQVQLWRWRAMLVEAVPLAIGTAVATLLTKVDLVLLSRLDTFESVGQYSVAYKFADILALVASAVLAPAMTLLVRAWPTRPEEFRQRCRAACLLLAMFASFALTGFWAAAGPLITTLYGAEYAPSVDAARLLVAGASVAMLAQVAFCVLVSAGQQRLYPFVALLGLGLNVGLNLWLIPVLSFYGAALATVVTEVVVLVLMWAAVRRTVAVRGLLPLGRLGAVAVATVLVVLAGEGLGQALPSWLVVGGSVLATAGVAWLLDLPGARRAPDWLAARARGSSR